jgi:hypothetical protein
LVQRAVPYDPDEIDEQKIVTKLNRIANQMRAVLHGEIYVTDFGGGCGRLVAR